MHPVDRMVFSCLVNDIDLHARDANMQPSNTCIELNIRFHYLSTT